MGAFVGLDELLAVQPATRDYFYFEMGDSLLNLKQRLLEISKAFDGILAAADPNEGG